MEDVIERHLEHAGEQERHLKRRRVPALLDGDDGLPGHADALGELGLRHLAGREPQGPDGVRDPCRLHHCGRPFRYAMTLVTEPRIAERKKHRQITLAIQNRSHPAIAMSIAAPAPITTKDEPTESPSVPIRRSRSSLRRESPPAR